MNGKLKKFLIYLVIPLLVILVLLSYNKLLGIACAIVYLGYLLFIGRAMVYSYIGNYKYFRGDLAGAVTWLGKAYKCARVKPKFAVSYAYLLLKSGDLKKSEEVINTVLSWNLGTDELAYAKSNLALVLWKKGELDSAVSTLEQLFENYKTTTIYGSLGYLLILKGDLDKALQFNLEAYDYNNKNAVILDNLGQTYYLKGEYDKACEVYDELMKSNPTFPEAYYNYGLVLLEKGETIQALEMMEKALTYDFSFLSTVTRQEIESKIEDVRQNMLS